MIIQLMCRIKWQCNDPYGNFRKFPPPLHYTLPQLQFNFPPKHILDPIPQVFPHTFMCLWYICTILVCESLRLQTVFRINQIPVQDVIHFRTLIQLKLRLLNTNTGKYTQKRSVNITTSVAPTETKNLHCHKCILRLK